MEGSLRIRRQTALGGATENKKARAEGGNEWKAVTKQSWGSAENARVGRKEGGTGSANLSIREHCRQVK